MSKLQGRSFYSDFEEALSKGNGEYNVSRAVFISYWNYLGYLSSKDQDELKAGDALTYKGMRVIYAYD